MGKSSLNSIWKKIFSILKNIIAIFFYALILGFLKLITGLLKVFTNPNKQNTQKSYKYYYKGIALIVLLSLFIKYSYSQELQRRALFGAMIQDVNDSVKTVNKLIDDEACYLYRVYEGTAAHESGLVDGDVILRANGSQIINKKHFVSIISKLKENDLLLLDVVRDSNPMQIECKLKAYPKDTYEFADVVYDYFEFKGEKIRQIIVKPKGEGVFPTLFFIPGYTCSSIDNMGENNPYEKLITGLVKNGFAVCKTEKPGLGDCEGNLNCKDIEFLTEVSCFEEGFNNLTKYNFIDTSNVFVFGHSMGGVIAPVMQTDFLPRGIAVYGTVVRSWYEYFIEQMRIQQFITGEDYVENDLEFNNRASFYYKYLIEKCNSDKLLQDEIYANILEEHWSFQQTGYMSGRSYEFWQQLQDLNLIADWAKYSGKVLTMWGDCDFVAFSKYDHQLAAEVVNHYHPGNAVFVELPNIDHGFVRADNMGHAVKILRDREYRLNNFNEIIVSELANWMSNNLIK